jgi:hypothetical protein
MGQNMNGKSLITGRLILIKCDQPDAAKIDAYLLKLLRQGTK